MIDSGKDDIFVRTKLVELRIRSGEIIVTRLFSSHIHHPLILFTITDEGLQSTSPDKIKLVDGVVQFSTKSGIEGSIRTSLDTILLQMKSIHKLGFMFPSIVGQYLFGDQIHPIDKKFTTTAQYHCATDDPAHQQLLLPMVHMTTDNCCLTVSSPKESSIEFCHYVHNGFPYFNATCTNDMQVSFRSFNNQRSAICDFYRRHGYSQSPPISGPLNVFQAKKALYTNCKILVPKINEQIIEDARAVQSILGKENLSSCIFGSLAMALNGYKVEVNDVDIAVKYLDHAKQAFKDHEISIASTGKWKDCSFRLNMGQTQIDVVQLYKFDWNNVTENKGLTVLSKYGLLFMKLFGEFERSLMSPNYQTFRDKNCKNIVSLFDEAMYVYPFFSQFLHEDAYSQYFFMQNLMQDAEWDFVSLSLSFPLYANAYKKEDTTFIPVINDGSPTPGKIRIGKYISSAIWYSLSSGQHGCEVSSAATFSDIKIPLVEHAGLLVGKHA